MNLYPSTHLLIVFGPENEEHALALVVHDILADTDAPLRETGVEPILSSVATSFPPVRSEKLITLALSRPLSPLQINAIAGLVTAGMISGFIVRGDIDPGGHMTHSQNSLLDEQFETSKARGSQGVPNAQEQARLLTERARYQLAIDTSTTE